MPRISLFLVLALLTFSIDAAVILQPERRLAPVTTDPIGIASGGYEHGIATDGDTTLIAWPNGSRIFISEIGRNGDVRATTPLPFEGSPSSVLLAWNGEAYVLAWAEQGGINVVLLDRVGSPITAVHHLSVKDQYVTSLQDIAINDGRILIIYSDYSGAAAMVVSRELEVIHSGLASTRTTYRNVAVSIGESFVILSVDNFENPKPHIAGIRISKDGVEETGWNIALGLDSTSRYFTSVDAVVDGDEIFIVAGAAQDGSRYWRRVFIDASFNVHRELSPIVRPLNDGLSPQVVLERDGSFVIYAIRTYVTPYALELFRFTRAAPEPGLIAIPIDSGFAGLPQFELVFAQRLVGVISSANAFVIDNQSLRVTSLGSRARALSAPFTAANGNEALVVWGEHLGGTERVLATRVAADGHPLDATPIIVGSVGYPVSPIRHVAVVAVGDEYWIAWPSGSSAAQTPTIVKRRMRTNGTFIDEATAVASGYYPLMATNGQHVLIVSGTIATRYTAAGQFVDRITLPFSAVAIASNGSDFVIVLDERIPYTGCGTRCPPWPRQMRLRAMRVHSSGSVLDPEPIPLMPFAENTAIDYVTATSDGRDFLVSYALGVSTFTTRLLREGSVAETIVTDTQAPPLDAEGSLVLTNPMLTTLRVQETNFAGSWGSLTQFANGSYFVAYLRRAEEPELAGAPALYGRVVGIYTGARPRTVRH